MTAASQLFSDFDRVLPPAGLLRPGQISTFFVRYFGHDMISRTLEQYVGNGRVAGTVFSLVTPAPARKVRLHDRASGRQVRETVSDGSGAYEFLGLPTSREYFVTAFDVDGGYNAVIQDRVTPAAIVSGPYVPPPTPGLGAGNYTPSYPLAFDLTGSYTTPVPLAFDLV